MKKTESMKEMILVKKLKAEDSVELPMDESFYNNLHDRIMLSVDNAEIKKLSKLSKTWVFLERKTSHQRAKFKKAAKAGVSVLVIAAAFGLLQLGYQSQVQNMNLAQVSNQEGILQEAQKNPAQWSELAATYQNENDLFAEMLSQQDLSTIVELNKALSSSL